MTVLCNNGEQHILSLLSRESIETAYGFRRNDNSTKRPTPFYAVRERRNPGSKRITYSDHKITTLMKFREIGMNTSERKTLISNIFNRE
ncbi:hypothetical protein RB195_010201 [Necator americanus]|uniref:Uncharacterized protein n=1 Tax=Necator americanus TaxID=51031 RepID=A0ABR1CWV4_NECAM